MGTSVDIKNVFMRMYFFFLSNTENSYCKYVRIEVERKVNKVEYDIFLPIDVHFMS